MSGGLPWRVGRKVGRTVYDANDELIGVMDSRELATVVVNAVNHVTASQADRQPHSDAMGTSAPLPRQRSSHLRSPILRSVSEGKGEDPAVQIN